MFKEVCQVSGGDSVSQQVLGVLGGSIQILMGFSGSQDALMCLSKVLVGLNRCWQVVPVLGRSWQVLVGCDRCRRSQHVTAGHSGYQRSGWVWTGCSGSQWVSACLGRFGRSRWELMGLDGGSWQVSPGLGRSNQVLTHLDWSWLVSVGLRKSHQWIFSDFDRSENVSVGIIRFGGS